MTAAAEAPRASTPWHVWVVGLVSLLWNGYGAYDYTMSHLLKDDFYRQMHMTDAQIATLHAYPVWMHGVWAIGVWGSFAGSILLLLRMRWAFHAFALSALGAIGLLLYTALGPARETMGLVFPVVIIAICLLLAWYAQLMAKRGVLR